MKDFNSSFRQDQHRVEGFIGMLLMATWVIGSIVAVGLQAGITA